MSPNNGISINGVLRSKLLNIPFASCYFINFDFLLPHAGHFDDNIVSPLLVFENFGFMFSAFFFSILSQPTFLLEFFQKNLDFSTTELAHFDACLITLFAIITFLDLYYQHVFNNLNNTFIMMAIFF